MDLRASAALTIFGGASFLSLGFVAIGFTSSLPASTASSTALQAWGETLGLVILGAVLLICGMLIGLSKWPASAGAVGVLLAIVGAFIVVEFYQAVTSIQSTGSQGAFASLAVVGIFTVLFVGFPLALMGSFGGIFEAEKSSSSAA